MAKPGLTGIILIALVVAIITLSVGGLQLSVSQPEPGEVLRNDWFITVRDDSTSLPLSGANVTFSLPTSIGTVFETEPFTIFSDQNGNANFLNQWDAPADFQITKDGYKTSTLKEVFGDTYTVRMVLGSDEITGEQITSTTAIIIMMFAVAILLALVIPQLSAFRIPIIISLAVLLLIYLWISGVIF